MSLSGSVVFSLAGRDKGRYFIVVGVLDEDHVLIANGRSRKIGKPKKKKLKHLSVVGKISTETEESLKRGELTDKTAAKITASYHMRPKK